MATPIIIKPNRPAEIIVGRGQTAGSPIFVEGVAGGSSSGGSELVDELLGLPDSLPEGYVIPSDKDIYRTLEDVFTAMDLDLSAEQAADFTAQATMLVGKDMSIGDTLPLGKGSSLEQFYGVVPPQDCEFITEQEVCSEMESIMRRIDPDLTTEQAKTITQNTLNQL